MSESILHFSIQKIDSDIRQNDTMPLNTGNCISTKSQQGVATPC